MAKSTPSTQSASRSHTSNAKDTGLRGNFFERCSSPWPALLIICVWVFMLRWTTFGLPMLFFDDGETMYHALAMLNGQVPYRDDVSHHFLGYVLPVTALGTIFPLTVDLLRVIQLCVQCAMGVGVYWALRWGGFAPWALLGALLAVTEREPWILSLYPLLMISAVGIWVFALAIRAARAESTGALFASFALAGIGILIDQRGLFFVALPLFVTFTAQSGSFARRINLALKGMALVAAPITCFVLWLAANGAVHDFIFQTLIFPQRYRVGSYSVGEQLQYLVRIHWYLVKEDEVLLFGAAIGMWVAAARFRDRTIELPVAGLCALAAFLLVFVAGVGGRKFSYYTLPWIPFLAFYSMIALEYPSRRVRAMFIAVFVGCILLVSTSQWKFFRNIPRIKNSDIVTPYIARLRRYVRPKDTVYLWGYRPELYVRLGKLAAFRHMNQIFINPESGAVSKANYSKHVHPESQREFMAAFARNPPAIIMQYYRGRRAQEKSRSARLSFRYVQRRYRRVVRIIRRDSAGARNVLKAFLRTDLFNNRYHK